MENFGKKRQPRTHYPPSDYYLTVSILNKLKSKMEQSIINICYQPLFFHYNIFTQKPLFEVAFLFLRR